MADEIEIFVEFDPEFLWVREQLQDAGFSSHASTRLALADCEWRAAISSFKAGATEQQVLDIYLD